MDMTGLGLTTWRLHEVVAYASCVLRETVEVGDITETQATGILEDMPFHAANKVYVLGLSLEGSRPEGYSWGNLGFHMLRLQSGLRGAHCG